jgi:shikimate kinase
MIIFINGSINSGKSTISKLLSQKIDKPAVVEIDSLSEFIEWMPIEEKISINLENAVSVIGNFAKRKFNIVIPYPLSQKNYNYMMENLKDVDEKIFVFTLNPKLETILKNRGERELDDWERNRIKYHYEKGINNPSFGIVIDNTNQSPEETVNIIFDEISK